MHQRNAILTIGLVLAAALPSLAQGLVIPNDPDLPPLALQRHKVKVEIDRQAAVTAIEQVFVNNTERPLEAQYVFPIPKGATMSKFTMIVNGKEQAGQIVEKNEARRVYNQIVHRSQDPGLLEYLGNEVFRANIFPILPKASQTITLRFEQILPATDSLVHYNYPVRTQGKKGATVEGEFSMELSIKSQAPIVNLYSPSHTVDIQRPNEKEARVSYAQRHTTLEKDFQLFYSLSEKDVALNLVTCRPDPKEPGFFMMLLAPKSKLQAERIVLRDIVFVVDVSGSMAGEKISQCRNALKYLVSKLNDGDRFNIVQFSSYAEAWQKGLVTAKERRAEAIKFADTLIAQGGTDIWGALDTALATMPKDPERPGFIIFMTDGQPTMGETTDPRRILQKVEKARNDRGADSFRLFTWGVGYDVDTYLLDAMSNLAGGVSEYVRPEEDIAAKVASFANKASQPVLTGLELKVLSDKIQLLNMQPRRLPDLYAGSQVVILGRYTGEGDAALTLTGRVNGKTETLTVEGTFAAAESKHPFVELLWAQRRIGDLLDQIRMRGESKELVDDVIRLSKEYGIQTPYTSTLILENQRQLGDALPRREAGASAGGRLGRPGRGMEASPKVEAAEKKLDELAAKEPAKRAAAPSTPAPTAEEVLREEARDRSLAQGFKAKDGKAGVEAAMALRTLKEADKTSERSASLSRKAAGTRFYLYRDMWVDERFEAENAVTSVKFGGEAYFKLIEREPKLVEALKLGTEVLFVTASGRALVVCASGEEKLTDAQIEELFKAPAKK